MGADLTLMYYGLRFALSDDNEEVLTQLETEEYPIIQAAKSVGLDTWWGYSDDSGNIHLLIGRQLAILSAERLGEDWTAHKAIRDDEFLMLAEDVSKRLKSAGIGGEPMLHAQFEPDM